MVNVYVHKFCSDVSLFYSITLQERTSKRRTIRTILNFYGVGSRYVGP